MSSIWFDGSGNSVADYRFWRAQEVDDEGGGIGGNNLFNSQFNRTIEYRSNPDDITTSPDTGTVETNDDDELFITIHLSDREDRRILDDKILGTLVQLSTGDNDALYQIDGDVSHVAGRYVIPVLAADDNASSFVNNNAANTDQLHVRFQTNSMSLPVMKRILRDVSERQLFLTNFPTEPWQIASGVSAVEFGSTDAILYYTDSTRRITLGFGTHVDREVTKSLEVGVGIRIYKDDDNFVQGIIETIQHLSLYSRITLEADTRVSASNVIRE